MPSLYLIRWLDAFSLIGLVASTQAGTHQIEGRLVGVTDTSLRVQRPENQLEPGVTGVAGWLGSIALVAVDC